MKKKLLLVYVLVAFVLLCTNVYAMVTAELSLTANKTTVKPGDKVTVTVNLKNLSSPVSSIEGYINVDENTLSGVSKDMIVTDENNKIEVKSGTETTNALSFAYNPATTDADYDVIFNTSATATEGNDVFFVMDFAKDISVDSEILKLEYTVKNDVEDGDIANAVKLDCIVAYSDTTNDKSGELSADLDIKVSKEAAEENTNTNNEVENTNTNENTNENTNKNTNTNTNKNTNTNNNKNTNTNTNKNTNKNIVVNVTNAKDNTVSGTKIPAAGLRTVLIPIVVFMVLAYVSYRKYMAYKEV